MQKLHLALLTVAVLIPLAFFTLLQPVWKDSLVTLDKEHVLVAKPEKNVIIKQVESKKDKQGAKKSVVSKEKKKISKPVIVIDASHQRTKDLTTEPIAPKSTERRAKQLASAIGVVTKQKEYHVTMNYAKALRTQLEEKGYKVVLTRSAHDVKLSNKERAKVANKARATLVISLHADGGKSYQNGFYIMSPSKKSTTSKRYKKSNQQANAILKKVSTKGKVFSTGHFYREDLALFNYTKAPAISIQLGFLTNVKDDKKLADNVYMEKLVKRIANGIQAAK
ncbi:N-acetylmuramoyl-L-alanine amidase [Kurthia populi]|uniref:N-acetylmuramoyl-L-alanine amidase n=1 Tax=Kurthia populi TaxID=1562132 RepID=A0ABW5Y0J4_9BACL